MSGDTAGSQTPRLSLVGVGATALLGVLLFAGYRAGEQKVLVVSAVAFLAMAGFAVPGMRAAGVWPEGWD